MTEKIWIYTLSKELDETQRAHLLKNCEGFVGSWTAHDQPLTGSFELYKNRLLIMKVDESAYNASGCSIDKLQRFIQQQEKEFNVELLNRLLIALEVDNEILIVHSTKIKDLLSQSVIKESTFVYDTSVSSSLQMKEWKKPLKNTWLNKFLPGLHHN